MGAPHRDRHGVTVAEPFGGDAQVHLALAPHHHFVDVGIVHDRERRIFLGELGEGRAELDVVLAFLRRDRDRRAPADKAPRRRAPDAAACRSKACRRSWRGRACRTRRSRRPPPAPRFSNCGPCGLNTPDTRPASRSGVLKVVPSPAFPVNTRATDILPPCAVWKVLSTSATASARLDAEPPAVSATPGASWRSAFNRRSTPFVRVGGAEQHRADQAVAQFLGEIVEHLVARRLDVLEQLLHQLVVVVGERFQHREARCPSRGQDWSPRGSMISDGACSL